MNDNVKVTKEALSDIAEFLIKSKLVEIANKTASEIIDVVEKKNHDYGDAWQRYGIFTPLIRINDKILRVKTLSTGESALVADESIEDTLKDIIGYALLALLKIRHDRLTSSVINPEYILKNLDDES